MSSFEKLGICASISYKLDQLKWVKPTYIQEEAIPQILSGIDVLMIAKRGKGKRGAICLSVTQNVLNLINENIHLRDNDRPESFVLNVENKGKNLLISEDLLEARSETSTWQGCRANKGVKRLPKNHDKNRKYYFEVFFIEEGLARIGWSLAHANLELGTDKDGWGYGGTAKKSNANTFIDYGKPFGAKSDVIGCIIDLNNGNLIFTKQGVSLGSAYTLPTKILETNEIYPALSVKTASCRIRFSSESKVNNYKPDDCFWIDEAIEKQTVIHSSFTGNSQNAIIKANSPIAIILEPDENYARRTFKFIETLSSDSKIKVKLITDETILENISEVHIAIVTPSRLSKLIREKEIGLDKMNYLAFDECDILLQQGHLTLIMTIFSLIPRILSTGRRVQTIFCAKSNNHDIENLTDQLMFNKIVCEGEMHPTKDVHKSDSDTLESLAEKNYQNRYR